MKAQEPNSIRLWLDFKRDPLWNMAADTWLAENIDLQSGEWIFRLYSWYPGALTIGRNQSWERAINPLGLADGDVAIRRITGGRAIYHDSAELTYAVVFQPHEAESGAQVMSPAEARAIGGRISDILAEYLRRIGLEANIERGSVGAIPHSRENAAPACFLSVARHEIRVGGQKMVAGAQRILGNRYFQHGSIKLEGQIPHPALHGMDTCSRRSVSAEIDRRHNWLRFKESVGMMLDGEIENWTPSDLETQQISDRKENLDWTSGNAQSELSSGDVVAAGAGFGSSTSGEF